PEDWASGDFQVLAHKWSGNDQRSWVFRLESDGRLAFFWSEDGASVDGAVNSTVPVPTFGRGAVRVTLDVNNGSGGHTVQFWTAATLDGPWAALGPPAEQGGLGTTSIFASTTPLYVAGGASGSIVFLDGATFT